MQYPHLRSDFDACDVAVRRLMVLHALVSVSGVRDDSRKTRKQEEPFDVTGKGKTV
jgi:hypothetical protein